MSVRPSTISCRLMSFRVQSVHLTRSEFGPLHATEMSWRPLTAKRKSSVPNDGAEVRPRLTIEAKSTVAPQFRSKTVATS